MNTVFDYEAALKEFYEADRALMAMAHSMRNFAESIIEYPGETCFESVEREEVPPLTQLMPGRRWASDYFMSPSAVQNAIRRRLFARKRAADMYNSLPPTARKDAPPPPSA